MSLHTGRVWDLGFKVWDLGFGHDVDEDGVDALGGVKDGLGFRV
jgi:hypothetical protein